MWLWIGHGHHREGRDWLARALARGDAAPVALRTRGLQGLAWLTLFQGDDAGAAALFDQSLAMARKSGDAWGTAMALHGAGAVARYQGDYERAKRHAEAAVAHWRAAGEAGFASVVLGDAGIAAFARGDYERAEAFLNEALTWQREVGFGWGAANSLRGLGDIARVRGDVARAAVCYAESLALAREQGDPRYVAYALVGLALVASATGQAERAARLFGAAARIHEATDLPIQPLDRAAFEDGVVAARVHLNEGAFATAWAAGQALPLDQAIAEALTIPAPPLHPSPVALTPREREILPLLVAGKTDREIAAALFIGPRTVETHLAHVYAKLGVRSRAGAAAAAVAAGLVDPPAP
jgi:non-specific serine/threonine protein kinase